MRKILLLLLSLFLLSEVSAQDLLVKLNGEKLKVKVLEVSKRKVKYVRQGTESPVYSLAVSEIDYIQYPLGDRDTFGKSGLTSSQSVSAQEEKASVVEVAPIRPKDDTSKWLGPVPPPSGKNNQSIKSGLVDKVYSIGEIYEEGDVRGVVVLLTDGGRHGVVMSLDEACLEWSTIRSKELKIVGAMSMTNGVENMATVERFIAQNGLKWSDFPAFEWCRAHGEGWYLPSLNELWSAGTMYLGGSRVAVNRPLRKAFNATVEMAGGQPLSNSMYYFSSTEDKDVRYAHYTHMSAEIPHTNTEFKGTQLFVRAFHKF